MEAPRALSLLDSLTALLSAQGNAAREMSEVLKAIADATGTDRLILTRQTFDGRARVKVCEGRRATPLPDGWRGRLPVRVQASSIRFTLEAEAELSEGVARERLEDPFCTSILVLLASEAEQRRVANLCMELRAPTFEEEDNLHSFADRIADRIREATDASYVAIRVDHGEFRLSQCGGFAADPDGVVIKEELELGPGSQLLRVYDLAAPAKAVTVSSPPISALPRPSVFRGTTDPVLREVQQRASDQAVGSVVLFPFFMPNGRGVITLSFRSKTYPSQHDLGDLTAIVNSASASITTFIGFQNAMAANAKLIRDFQVFTNQELIQGYRHAASNAFELMRIKIHRLRQLLKREGVTSAEQLLSEIQESDGELARALEGMHSLKVNDEERFRKFDLETAYLEAKEALRDKLDELDIRCTVTKEGSSTLYGNYNLVRVAFVNLILNSIQALKDAPKGPRQIVLYVAGSDTHVSGTFSDTGVGFSPKGNVRQLAEIWQVGKTTKAKGTGYGLPLVRFVFQDIQKGSIDVKDFKNGMTFAYRLPRGPARG